MVPAMTRVLVLSCSLLSIAASVEAQTATGTLSGVIRDTTGAVMPGVSVTARNAATGVSRIVASDSEGRYRIVNLEPGEYEVRAELAGFRTAAMTGVTVLVGGTTELESGHVGRPARRRGHGRHGTAADRTVEDGSQSRREQPGDRIAADQRTQLRGFREAVERRGARPRERGRRRVQGAGRRRRVGGGPAAVVWRPAGAEHA